jgi:hypothetical protein
MFSYRVSFRDFEFNAVIGQEIIPAKEEAIEALFGDKVDEVVLYMIDAIKDPFLRSILYTRASEYKDQHKT